ncbi:hypothetical protein L207DRAFT_515314 [Hyaloscypha variabilis F]|uniref:Uncharacterized protein n=1 Tax=Hyaloscypha variabilis (strain UAMH 11265 / GT02V1 / F) TaxID=1149755 RepID=A0A2J6RE66_HYAVF|nr:hypothetical protein L207DRAFT_515314 [Hyaloscypha variabilis F]
MLEYHVANLDWNLKDKGEWPTPVRQTIRNLKRQGKSQREIVTRRVDKKRCISYMRSVYRSGRVSVMI